MSMFCFSPGAEAQLVDPPKKVDLESAKLVRQLLSDDWEREPKNRANSKSTYTALRPSSTVVTLAYVLNRIQHNEKREALRVAEQLTAQDPDSVDAWLLRSWLNALINNYDRSLIDLHTLKKRIPNLQTLEKSQSQEIFRRMGKLIGYMQGPVHDQVSPEIMESSLIAIADGLSPRELEALTVSRETVLARYDNLTRTQMSKAAVELEKKTVEDEVEKTSLADQLVLLDQSLQQLGEEKEQLTAEGNQQIADLSSQIGPLESDLGSLTNQIRSVRYDLQYFYNSLFIAQNADVIYEPTIFYLNNQIRDLEYQLRLLRSDARAVSNQIQTVQVQIDQTRRAYNEQIAALNRQQGVAEKSKTRRRVRLAKLSAGPEIARGKKEAMSNRRESLTTYYDLPVELYRQQLLDLVE